MNHNPALIDPWARAWRMSFSPDPQKQVVELTFSRKMIENYHPVIYFNGIHVKKKNENKHLGILPMLPYLLIKSIISKAGKGISLLKYFSK